MKRKVETLLAIALVIIAVVFFLTTLNTNTSHKEYKSSSISATTEDAITVRNMTHGTVHYWIKPSTSNEEPEKKSLDVGKIHRYPGHTGIDITYERVDRVDTRFLFPGKPYSFRYDNQNLVHLYEGSHGREDAVDLAPFVPTPMAVMEKMLEMAEVDASDVVFDLGCGDGRIVITAARKYGARGVGIDIVPQRIKESREGAKKAGVEELVEFRLGDLTKMDFSEATVVTLYLLPESNELLRPLFDKQLRPGTYVVSHNYSIPGWEEKEVEVVEVNDEEGETHTIFLYKR